VGKDQSGCSKGSKKGTNVRVSASSPNSSMKMHSSSNGVALSGSHISTAFIDSTDATSLDFSGQRISEIPEEALNELSLLANGVIMPTRESEGLDDDGEENSTTIHRQVLVPKGRKSMNGPFGSS